MYVSSTKEFKILRGDRLLILGIAGVLSQNYSLTSPEKYAEQFQVPVGFKINKSDTYAFSVGLFYGKPSVKPLHKRKFKMNQDPENMKSEVFR